MSLIFLAKSNAYSWKMSFDGQVLCQRMLIGPCACTTAGAATAAPATAAPLRNLRRVLRAVLALSVIVGFLPIPDGRMNLQLKACPELSRQGHAPVTVPVTVFVTASAKAQAIATSSRRSKRPAAPP